MRSEYQCNVLWQLSWLVGVIVGNWDEREVNAVHVDALWVK